MDSKDERSAALTILEEFGAALGRRDFTRMAELMDPRIRFQALTPDGLREAVGADSAIRWYQDWFRAGAEHQSLSCEVFTLGDRAGLRWRGRRLLSRRGRPEAWYLIEQDSFADIGPLGIEQIAIVCSGHRPEPPRGAAAEHEFDAGDLGCSDGLPQELRRRLRDVPVGGRLRVVARDPSAKEDLPSLARMMGQAVESVEESGDGRLFITIERRV